MTKINLIGVDPPLILKPVRLTISVKFVVKTQTKSTVWDSILSILLNSNQRLPQLIGVQDLFRCELFRFELFRFPFISPGVT